MLTKIAFWPRRCVKGQLRCQFCGKKWKCNFLHSTGAFRLSCDWLHGTCPLLTITLPRPPNGFCIAVHHPRRGLIWGSAKCGRLFGLTS